MYSQSSLCIITLASIIQCPFIIIPLDGVVYEWVPIAGPEVLPERGVLESRLIENGSNNSEASRRNEIELDKFYVS